MVGGFVTKNCVGGRHFELVPVVDIFFFFFFGNPRMYTRVILWGKHIVGMVCGHRRRIGPTRQSNRGWSVPLFLCDKCGLQFGIAAARHDGRACGSLVDWTRRWLLGKGKDIQGLLL